MATFAAINRYTSAYGSLPEIAGPEISATDPHQSADYYGSSPSTSAKGTCSCLYAGAPAILASIAVALTNASASGFFESRPTSRKTLSRHSDGEGAVNLDDYSTPGLVALLVCWIMRSVSLSESR